MRKILVIIAIMQLCLCCEAAYADSCGRAPKFRLGIIYEKTSAKLVKSISVAPEDFTRRDLLCLGKELEQKYKRHKEVDISVFDDNSSAAQRLPIPMEANARDYKTYQHEHAMFTWTKVTDENYIILEPDVWNESTHTKIRLNSGQLSSCNIAISQDRCLMIIGTHLRYPEEAWRNSKAGSVVINVTVAENGIVTDARAANIESVAESLQRTALEDARSWRFEPGSRVEELHVTYVFRLTGSVDLVPREVVRYSLPDRAEITANAAR